MFGLFTQRPTSSAKKCHECGQLKRVGILSCPLFVVVGVIFCDLFLCIGVSLFVVFQLASCPALIERPQPDSRLMSMLRLHGQRLELSTMQRFRVDANHTNQVTL